MEHKREFFPDGTPIDGWFYDTQVPALEQLGRPFRLDEYGVPQDGEVFSPHILNAQRTHRLAYLS